MWPMTLCVLSCIALSACEDQAQLAQDQQTRAAISDYMGEANCRKAHPKQEYEAYQQCLKALKRRQLKKAGGVGW